MQHFAWYCEDNKFAPIHLSKHISFRYLSSGHFHNILATTATPNRHVTLNHLLDSVRGFVYHC